MANIKNICIIPCKAASTRLPQKNILPLAGHPLVAHSIKKAIKSKIFDTVMVSTENNYFADIAREYGAQVPFLRPEYLSKDPSTIVDVIIHVLNQYAKNGLIYNNAYVLLPTTPFVKAEDIIEATKTYKNHKAEALLSVTLTNFPPFNAWIVKERRKRKSLVPCFPDSPYSLTKSTECPPTYKSNGGILIADSDKLLEKGHYKDLKLVPYVMPRERSIDIDTKLDYEFAKFLLNSNVCSIEEGLFNE